MKKQTGSTLSYILKVVTYGICAMYSVIKSTELGGVEGAILFIGCLIAVKFMSGVEK